MATKPIDAEVIQPEATSLVQRTSPMGDAVALTGNFDPEQALALAEKRMTFLNRLVLLSLRRTTQHDWADMGGRPYLQATGAEKLKALWGIYFRDLQIEDVRSDGDPNPSYLVSGVCGSHVLGLESAFVGGRNGNDDFFGRQRKPDAMDIRKAAVSNWEVNAITRLLGLRGLTFEQVYAGTGGGVGRETASGQVNFKQGAQGGRGPAEDQPVERSEEVKRALAIYHWLGKDAGEAWSAEHFSIDEKDKDGNKTGKKKVLGPQDWILFKTGKQLAWLKRACDAAAEEYPIEKMGAFPSFEAALKAETSEPQEDKQEPAAAQGQPLNFGGEDGDR